jgi:hypothetical protein
MESIASLRVNQAPVFLSAFMAAVSMFYYPNIDPNNRPIIVPNNQLRTEYDFIIVGGGTAGKNQTFFK